MTTDTIPNSDKYLPAVQVQRRYGVSDMTVWRWLKDPDMGFPQPYYFGRLRFWKLSALEQWERAQVRQRA
jgi:predicted DNA-binding transcriptional regulator AlpA